MDTINQTLQSFSSYCWPIVVIIVIFIFRNTLRNLLESAQKRKFTIKVGGNEITMEEASEQQRKIISDIQNQIISIQKELADKETTLDAQLRAKMKVRKEKNILWVDDNPKNNSTLIDYFLNQGFKVIKAISTEEAISILRNKYIDRIITNMGRIEAGIRNRTAGIDLIKKVREINKEILIVVFCNTSNYELFNSEAEIAGANKVTTSSTELIEYMQL